MRTVLRGAQVITMSPERPDAEQIDILIDGDRIADMGELLDRPAMPALTTRGLCATAPLFAPG